MAYTARGSTLPVAAEKYVYGSKPGFEMNSRVWVPKKDCGVSYSATIYANCLRVCVHQGEC
eukprot:8638-Heterococcus_DN1.PRE.1